MKLFDKTWKLAIAGAIVGVLAALLAFFGNPANMAICVACFIRDTAGALSLHSAAPVQYFRPEIVGFVVGAFIISLITKEYKATAGSSPMIRFLLGMIMMIGALFVVMLIYNIATGNFHLSFSGQPIAHSQHLWNILGMYVVGFGAVLAGGCPLRQLILAGQGSSDSAVTFLGMLLGAAFAHNFGLAGAAAKAATETEAAVAGGPATAGKAAVIACIIVLFIIAATNRRNLKRGK